MNTRKRRWLPIALCCLPGVAVAVIAGLSIALGGIGFGGLFGGPLGLGLIVLAMLACPLSMGLIMWRGSKQGATSGNSQLMADCCAPGEQNVSAEAETAAGRLAALRERRVALERELAEMQLR